MRIIYTYAEIKSISKVSVAAMGESLHIRPMLDMLCISPEAVRKEMDEYDLFTLLLSNKNVTALSDGSLAIDVPEEATLAMSEFMVRRCGLMLRVSWKVLEFVKANKSLIMAAAKGIAVFVLSFVKNEVVEDKEEIVAACNDLRETMEVVTPLMVVTK